MLSNLRGAQTIFFGSAQKDSIGLHTLMFDPLISKIIFKNSSFHKHSNDLFYFNIAPNIVKLQSILCAMPPRICGRFLIIRIPKKSKFNFVASMANAAYN